jgi:hypothetical protein
MKKRKIFYSIEVECKDEDLVNFIELNRPTGFCYEYQEEKQVFDDKIVSDFFNYLSEIMKPKTV